MRLLLRSPGTLRAALVGGACLLLAAPVAGHADSTTDELQQLRTSLKQQMEQLRREQQKLNQEFLRLDKKSELLDRQLKTLRAAGTGPGSTSPPTDAAIVAAPSSAPAAAAESEVAQTSSPAPSGAAAQSPPSSSPASSEGSSAPIQGPSAKEQQARRVVESAPTLSNTGGVLTPKGQIVIDPSVEDRLLVAKSAWC